MIKKIRIEKGWSQQDLADLAGLSLRTIQRFEKGQAVSIESCKALAAVWGMTLFFRAFSIFGSNTEITAEWKIQEMAKWLRRYDVKLTDVKL